jgi:hypothetical protein
MAETKKGHVDQRLTDVSIQYPQAEYASQYLFPETPVMKGADEFTIYNKINLFQTPDDSVGKYSEANELKLGSSTDTYSVRNRALRGFVAEEDRDNYDKPLDPEVDETEVLVAAILNNREVRAHALAVTIDNEDSPDNGWDEETGTPIADVETACQAMLIRPNLIVISEAVWNVLKNHADILARIGGGNPNIKMVTPEMFGSLFGISKVVIAAARYSSTKPKNEASLAYIWGEDVVLAYQAPNLGRKQPTFGRLFAQKLGGGSTFRVRKWEEEERGIGGATVIQVEHRSIEKVVAADFGYALTNCLQAGE